MVAALEPKPADMAVRAPAGLAEVLPVPAREAGRVLTPLHIWIETALTLLPIPVGIAGLVGGVALAISLSGHSPALGAVCGGGGLVIAVASVAVLLCFQQYLPGRYIERLARQAIASRADALVRPDDPDAVFLDIVPRSNWGRTMMEPATDVGYWRADARRREFHFEGDQKRLRIPFDSVLSCDVDEIRLDTDDWNSDLYFATVLTVDTANGPREYPLCGRHLRLEKRRMPERRAQAEKLCAAIRSHLGERGA